MLISVIFGMALAFMFRKVCKGEKCIVMEAPSLPEFEKYVYKIDDECYKYTPRVSSCVAGK